MKWGSRFTYSMFESMFVACHRGKDPLPESSPLALSDRLHVLACFWFALCMLPDLSALCKSRCPLTDCKSWGRSSQSCSWVWFLLISESAHSHWGWIPSLGQWGNYLTVCHSSVPVYLAQWPLSVMFSLVHIWLLPAYCQIYLWHFCFDTIINVLFPFGSTGNRY